MDDGEEEGAVSVRTWDLDGWKAIAGALGVSVRTAMRWAGTGADRMPVFQVRGRTKARAAAIRMWLSRQEGAA